MLGHRARRAGCELHSIAGNFWGLPDWLLQGAGKKRQEEEGWGHWALPSKLLGATEPV